MIGFPDDFQEIIKNLIDTHMRKHEVKILFGSISFGLSLAAFIFALLTLIHGMFYA
jgi:hypothetical protein